MRSGVIAASMRAPASTRTLRDAAICRRSSKPMVAKHCSSTGSAAGKSMPDEITDATMKSNSPSWMTSHPWIAVTPLPRSVDV